MFYCLNIAGKPIIGCLMADFIVTTYPIMTPKAKIKKNSNYLVIQTQLTHS